MLYSGGDDGNAIEMGQYECCIMKYGDDKSLGFLVLYLFAWLFSQDCAIRTGMYTTACWSLGPFRVSSFKDNRG